MQPRADMFVDPDCDPRVEVPPEGDGRTLLVAFLRWQRQTLELKCAGLDPVQLSRRAVEPSTMSLLGLVRHMAEVERGWFRRKLAGEDAPSLYSSDDAPDADFDGAVATAEAVDEAWAAWRAEVERADRFVADAPDLDVTGDDPWRGKVSLRWVLVHMIEEYARHLGHADLLRERIGWCSTRSRSCEASSASSCTSHAAGTGHFGARPWRGRSRAPTRSRATTRAWRTSSP